MNSLLFEKKVTFARLSVKLIEEAYRRGYQVIWGEIYRPPEMALIYAKRGTGIRNSLHTLSLACDLTLYLNGKSLTTTSDYEGLGLFWQSLSSPGFTCIWGGTFKRPDAFHFSIEHNGVK